MKEAGVSVRRRRNTKSRLTATISNPSSITCCHATLMLKSQTGMSLTLPTSGRKKAGCIWRGDDLFSRKIVGWVWHRG